MFCPVCKDEFRPGFTRCQTCNVDLVEDLSQEKPRSSGTPDEPQPQVRVADYCGFLALDEARGARELLKQHAIRSDILIREAAAEAEGRLQEEYWLRVEAERFAQVASILGYDAADAADNVADNVADDEIACSDCGQGVKAEETFCPSCGARFDE